jgi:hypothetical protein
MWHPFLFMAHFDLCLSIFFGCSIFGIFHLSFFQKERISCRIGGTHYWAPDRYSNEKVSLCPFIFNARDRLDRVAESKARSDYLLSQRHPR